MKTGKIFSITTLFVGIAIMMLSCRKSDKTHSRTSFTRIDSLTEAYLSLQDSMWNTWNLMMKDENEKIESIKALLNEMKKAEASNKDEIALLLEQTEQLERIRFTQKTLSNSHLVEEYDFASNALITEVIDMAESHPDFLQNRKWQHLADQIKSAEGRVSTYREEYDQVVNEYNALLDKIGPLLPEIDEHNDGVKKPTFYSEGE